MEKTGGGVLFRKYKLFLYLKSKIMFKTLFKNAPTFDITFNSKQLLIMVDLKTLLLCYLWNKKFDFIKLVDILLLNMIRIFFI